MRLSRSQRRSIRKYRRWAAAQILTTINDQIDAAVFAWRAEVEAHRLLGKRNRQPLPDDFGCTLVIGPPIRPREGEGARQAEREGRVDRSAHSPLPGRTITLTPEGRRVAEEIIEQDWRDYSYP